MPWHKIAFTEQEVEDGAPGLLEKQFRQRYAAAHAPEDAALFSNEIASEGIEYFLSPTAAELASDLLQSFHSVPCDTPDADTVRLTLGARGIEKRLL